jgi:dipeptidyl aminopeptidase/acylaminoacyl peptidase
VLAVSSAAKAALLRGAADTGWSLSLASGENPVPTPFWSFNQHLAGIAPPRKVTLSYTLESGKAVQCEAILPGDYVQGRRAPTVVSIYPNASHYFSGSQYGFVNPYDDALLTTMGYIVLYPYSSEPELRSADNPLANWATLVIPAMDALVKEGYADPERFSTYGISQGSWSVLALLSETHRFKAGMAGFGVANFVSHYGAFGIERRMWPDDLFSLGSALRYEMKAGTYPLIAAALVDDPMKYVRASPLFAAKNIDTPLLLIHTDLDVNFPMEQFDEMFTQMMRWRKEAQYVRYWGEEHGLTSPANIRDQWSRMFAWFDQWSDIGRDSQGKIVYEGNRVKQRGAAAALTPGDFLRLQWFFGALPESGSTQR